jgi:hypothetical protein
MRPSAMMQWLRLPTLAGLACGLAAIVMVAYGDAIHRRVRVPLASLTADTVR